tara:strand:- start:968 stop:1525 length:558 start_codon:yes stop_codon:yes gene_type:complete
MSARDKKISKNPHGRNQSQVQNQDRDRKKIGPVSTFMQWTYQGEQIDEIPEEYEGFVYLITNKSTGQKYIGKKLAKFKTTKPPLKGKKNKRRGKKESDWRDYWGSSDRLLADVAEIGEQNFTREILYLCKGRGEMSYIEAREQFDRRVLEKDDYYNGIINVRVGGSDKLKKALLEHSIKAKHSNT